MHRLVILLALFCLPVFATPSSDLAKLRQLAKQNNWNIKFRDPARPALKKIVKKDLSYKKDLRKSAVVIPPSLDYSETGKLPPIQNQGGKCGSCFAHGSLTSIWATANIKGYPPASPPSYEYMCNCSGYACCEGGNIDVMDGAKISNGGVPAASVLPYCACDTPSCPKKYTPVLSILDWWSLGQGKVPSTLELITALVQNGGPIPITINASGSWYYFGGGDPIPQGGCVWGQTDHIVALYAYDLQGGVFGSDGELTDKSKGILCEINSWGTAFGNQGLICHAMYDSKGRRCFNTADQVGTFELNIPKPEPTPSPSPVPVPVNLPWYESVWCSVLSFFGSHPSYCA